VGEIYAGDEDKRGADALVSPDEVSVDVFRVRVGVFSVTLFQEQRSARRKDGCGHARACPDTAPT
jgi:hypothetical protein